MNISLEEIIFTAEWVLEVGLPDNQPPVVDSSAEELVDITLEQDLTYSYRDIL